MKKILFDSDILIEHLRGNKIVHQELEFLLSKHATLAYTPISEAEIFHGMRPKEEEGIETMLSIFLCLEITKEVGRQAGGYLRTYAKSHGMDVADALIAASAAHYGFSLCTFNWKHYPMTDLDRYNINR